MLTEGHARRAFLLLDQSGLLREVLPEISALKGVEQPPEFHPEGDVFVHTLLVLSNLPQPCPRTLAWGTLLHDVGKPATFRVAPDRIRFDNHVEVGVKIAEEICARFKFSNDDTAQILALIANHMRFKDVPQMKVSTLKRFVRQDRFDEHLELHRLDCTNSHGHLDNYDLVRDFVANTPPEQVRPPRLITGDDLVQMGEADIRAAFHEEDIETWALAIAGASATVRAKVLGALTASASDALKRQLENLGPFRLSDSEAAQLEIADRLRRLHDRGWISLPEPNGRDEVLV